MPESARLALRFDPQRLQADLRRLASGAWTPHFNARFFDGDWSGIALRDSPSDRGLYASGASAAEAFAGTQALEACAYFQEVLETFQCPLKSVRLLRLAAGSVIREHSDFDLGEELGEVRFHIPVVTNPQVEFYLAGKRVVMDAGECWYLDLSLPHRVQNRGTTERVHLVIDCVLNDWLRHLISNPLPDPAAPSAATGAAAFQQFSQLVFSDPALRTALRDIQDLEEFLRQTVRRGKERGLLFTAGDVRAAWRAGKSLRRRRAQWGLNLMDSGEDWIPCRVAWEQQVPLVDWCYLGGARFTEAFFQDTISRALRRPFSAAFLRREPMDAWEETGRPNPAGLIFHMSRCGSTLISQMLKAISGVTVFSEAPPVDSIVRAPELGIEVSAEQHTHWLRWIGRALGWGSALGERGYFLKLDCWHVLDLNLFRRAFPSTPWIFLYRDPIQVLRSLASQPAEWTLPGYLKSERFGFDASRVPVAALAEYRALLLAGMLRSVLQYGDELEGRLVNYSELPDCGWTTLPRMFGLDISAQEIAEVQAAAKWDAKASGIAFAPDGERSRTSAAPELHALSETYLYPLYQKLEARRLRRV